MTRMAIPKRWIQDRSAMAHRGTGRLHTAPRGDLKPAGPLAVRQGLSLSERNPAGSPSRALAGRRSRKRGTSLLRTRP